MKSILLLLTLLLGSTSAFTTIIQVEVGGNQSTTPYYAPQFITIQVGDTVLWNFVQGTHNVTSTSGPASFASGDLGAGNTFQFVFTIAGFYEYECTRFSHATTQFGTITVEEPVGIDNPLFDGFIISPNPTSDLLKVETSNLGDQFTAQVFELGSAKLVKEIRLEQSTFEISVTDIPKGRYLLLVNDGKHRVARTFQRN